MQRLLHGLFRTAPRENPAELTDWPLHLMHREQIQRAQQEQFLQMDREQQEEHLRFMEAQQQQHIEAQMYQDHQDLDQHLDDHHQDHRADQHDPQDPFW